AADLPQRRLSDRERKRIRPLSAVDARVGRRAVDRIEASADVDARGALTQMEVARIGRDEARIAEYGTRTGLADRVARRVGIAKEAVRAEVLKLLGGPRRQYSAAIAGEAAVHALQRNLTSADRDLVLEETVVERRDGRAVDGEPDLARAVEHHVRDVDARAAQHRHGGA